MVPSGSGLWTQSVSQHCEVAHFLCVCRCLHTDTHFDGGGFHDRADDTVDCVREAIVTAGTFTLDLVILKAGSGVGGPFDDACSALGTRESMQY